MTDIDLVQKYGKFCGYMAWQFVKKSETLGTEDAEDLASIAMIGLLKCPSEHRHEPPYVKRLIINHIIKGRIKMLRHKNAEIAPDTEGVGQGFGSQFGRMGIRGRHLPGMASNADLGIHDWFDAQPGRDGLAGHTQVKFDSARVMTMLPDLPEAERIVVELSFGLGCEPIGMERIARKLGRTKHWVDCRLKRGLLRMREGLSVSA